MSKNVKTWNYYLISRFFLNKTLFLFFRGIIQCLKLSPNLRKQTKDVKTALMNKDPKKALELEVKKLEVLLAMVREPDENPSTLVREQEEI